MQGIGTLSFVDLYISIFSLLLPQANVHLDPTGLARNETVCFFTSPCDNIDSISHSIITFDGVEECGFEDLNRILHLSV